MNNKKGFKKVKGTVTRDLGMVKWKDKFKKEKVRPGIYRLNLSDGWKTKRGRNRSKKNRDGAGERQETGKKTYKIRKIKMRTFNVGICLRLSLSAIIVHERTMKSKRSRYDIMQFCYLWKKLKSLSNNI